MSTAVRKVADAGKQAAAVARRIQWETAKTVFDRRSAFVQVWGESGTGRTSFALTAPGPIYYIHSAEKWDGIVQKYAAEKEIQMCNFGGSFGRDVGNIAKIANEKLIKLKAAMEDGCDHARTVILDTHTDGYELIRLARFGTLSPKGHIGNMYAPINAEWKGIFDRFRDNPDVNIIVIGKAREQYRNDKPTGIIEPAGHKDFSSHYGVDVAIKTSKKKGVFTGTIEKGWFNASTEGVALEDDMLTFSQVMGLVTETDAGEWE